MRTITIAGTIEDLENIAECLRAFVDGKGEEGIAGEEVREVGDTVSVIIDSGITNSPNEIEFEILCGQCFGRGWVPHDYDDSRPCPAGCEDPEKHG